MTTTVCWAHHHRTCTGVRLARLSRSSSGEEIVDRDCDDDGCPLKAPILRKLQMDADPSVLIDVSSYVVMLAAKNNALERRVDELEARVRRQEERVAEEDAAWVASMNIVPLKSS